jgi:WD40 repeat protein
MKINLDLQPRKYATKGRSGVILTLVVVCLVLAACVGPATPPIFPAELTAFATRRYKATVVPRPTYTPKPPKPPPSILANLVPELAPLCEAAFAQTDTDVPALVSGQKIKLESLMAVLKDVLFPESGWVELPIAADLTADAPQGVQVVACVQTAPGLEREFVVTFNDISGYGKIFSIFWDLRLVRVADGKLLTGTTIRPDIRITIMEQADYHRDDNYYGPPPAVAKLEDWLRKTAASDQVTIQLADTLGWNTNGINDIALWPNTHTLAIAAYHELELWNIESGEVLNLLQPEYLDSSDTHVIFSPDGSSLVTWTRSAINQWDLQSGQRLASLLEVADDVVRLDLSPDMRQVATLEFDGTLRLWDLASSQLLGKWIIPLDRIGEMHFAPDGKSLAFSSDNGSVILFDLVSAAVRTLSPARQDIYYANGLTFTPDGQTLASWTFDQVSLWNIADGRLQVDLDLRQKAGQLLEVVFAPDGRSLVTGINGTEEVLVVWDVASGKRLYTLQEQYMVENVYEKPIFLSFGADGKTLLSVTESKELGFLLRVWTLGE